MQIEIQQLLQRLELSSEPYRMSYIKTPSVLHKFNKRGKFIIIFKFRADLFTPFTHQVLLHMHS